MDNRDLQKVNDEGFFFKLKNWFKNLFNKKDNLIDDRDIEFEKSEIQNNSVENELINNDKDKIQYQFDSNSVSKQKIEKIKADLDNGKSGIEELYQLSKNELEKLSEMYSEEIADTSAKLVEIDTNIQGYKRKLEKLVEQSNN